MVQAGQFWVQNDNREAHNDDFGQYEISNLLKQEDRKLLNAIASMQLSYGQANEAVALLLLCRLSAPDDLQTLRLLIRAYIALKWWDHAEKMLKEYNHYSNNKKNIRHLFQSLILLGKRKLSDAREQFRVYCENKLKVSE